MKTFLDSLALLIFMGASSFGLSQSVSTVEIYGPAPATQVYSGLGTNITSNNAWEYADAQAAHITWGRFDCGWQYAEIQNMPANTSGGYALPSFCSAGLASSKTYGVHPVMNALYGPPYSVTAVGTATSAVPIGATSVPITLSSGSLSTVVPGSTFLSITNGYLSGNYSYPGVLITGVSGSAVTLASATTTALAQGAAITLNLVLYPPVIVAPATSYMDNSSVQAYGNYATYLAQQIADSGNTGEVSIWNEPEWCCDKWDHGVDLYDNPPANNDVSTSLGVDLPLYVSTIATIPGVPFDNGYTETAMWPGSLFYPSTYSYVQNLTSLQSQFATESFHIYGNNPEDYVWNPSCVQANATPALLSNILSGACTPIGDWTGETISAAVASESFPGNNGGIGHSITEAGICRSCTGATETQLTRFNMRLFLSFQALGVTPVIFYRLSEDPDYEWVNADGTPYPVYTAFQGLMTDVGTIAQPPVTSCPPCSMPTVSSYTGYYPLATAAFVGARAGDQANSILYYTWQRTYGEAGWTAVASPPAVPVSVIVPTGMTVTSVKDMVTSTTVAFTFAGGLLTYPVADDPIEVLLTPATTSSQTITFPAIASRAYGSAPFAVTASSSLGSSYPVTITVQSGPAVISGSVLTLTGVGTVVLQATQAGNTVYPAATATQSFQVTPAPLNVEANNATRAYGAANPTFSGTVTGAVNGDTFSESFTTTATASSNAGSYAIVPSVAGTNLVDYAVTIVNGTLTVTGEATTTILSAPASAAYGASITLTATVSSASGTPTGTVTFASGSTPLGTGTLNGSGVATLSTTSLPAGTDSLTATYAAVGNFAASTSPALTLTISSGVASAQPGYSVAASPTSLTIPIGEAGNTTLTFTPTGGYSGSILLSCLNLPANAVCAFAQSQVALGGNNQTINLKLTIKTSAQQARSTPHNLLSSPLLAMAFWWPGGLTGFAVFVRKRKPVKTQHFWHLDLRLVGALVLAAGLSGCGMSGIAIGPGATSEVTVVATGISGTAVTTQTVVLTVRMMQ